MVLLQTSCNKTTTGEFAASAPPDTVEAAAGTSETHGNGVKYLRETVFSRSGLCAIEMGAHWWMDGWMDV